MHWIISVTIYEMAQEMIHDVADTRSVWEIARDLGIFFAACHGVHRGVAKAVREHNSHHSKRRKRQ